jgi:uncharacterized alpha/beta hydrolase family protein
MKKSFLSLVVVLFSLIIISTTNNSFALPEQPGGQWHFMWHDQWGHDNYQCQPVQQDPTCWPVWAWYVE